MKMAELQKKKDAELVKLLAEKRESLREFRFGVSSTSGNTSEGRTLRKEIARILTELNSRARVS